MMIYILKILTGIFLAYGIYELASYRLKLTPYKINRAARNYSKLVSRERENGSNVTVQTLALKISPYIKMNPYKRDRLSNELKSVGVDITPEMFKATSVAKAIFVLLFVIPCLMILPIGSVAVIVMAFATLGKDENELKKKIQQRKEEIELELPRFACTIKQELGSSRDVLSILDNYKRYAGDAMKAELEITVSDMRSGNYEAALQRFQSRISSSALSDVVRGLLSTLRGDDNRAYFEMLSHDLDEMEVQRLKAIAAKQPDKIKKYTFMLLICCIAMYFVILGVYAYENAKGIF